MITIKTGVPGSGKSLSMVAELLALQQAADKGAEPRPLYTNITGLAIPHVPMVNWEPTTKRQEGVLYTIDWRQCPAGALVVIDEAFLYGYDGKNANQAVPDYIRDLAVHRKDYSVDIWFIAQHPKLLHVALRRQVGKHQHYRRLFGWGTSVCYEWDQCQDNLTATKTAVVSRFRYPKAVFSAYKSAEVHTKPAFKKPWFIWIPIAIIPLAAWAVPKAYAAMSGAMGGKGLASASMPGQIPAAVAPPVAAPVANKPAGLEPPPAGFEPVTPEPAPSQKPPEVAGCIVTPSGCGCFDQQGKKAQTDEAMCQKLQTAPPAVSLASLPDQTYYRANVDPQMAVLVFGVNKPLNARP